MSVDLEVIKRALDDSLSTPWRVEEQPQHAPDRWVVVGYDAHVARCVSRQEAEMLASAPTWLADLVAEVEQLRAQVAARERDDRGGVGQGGVR
jgi:hypothetical protein